MLNHINWDVIFNWKVWQVMKWITGSFILITLIVCMYSSFSYRKRINSLVDDSNWDLLAISKVLYDSKATDKEMLDIIRVYVEQRIDENLKKKER